MFATQAVHYKHNTGGPCTLMIYSKSTWITNTTSLFLQLFYKMALPTSFIVLVAALLINIISYCSAENVYCVTSTATSCSSCSHNSINCATLSEYAQEAEMYFTSNTNMVFLPGDHFLDVNITVANVTRLKMCRESSSGNIAPVVRNGSVGFGFTNMADFKYRGFQHILFISFHLLQQVLESW